MSNQAAIAALLRYNANRSAQKKRDVQTALASLTEDPHQPITKSSVARRAGVSREFINSHPELSQLIENAAREVRKGSLPAHREDTTARGLHAQNRTFALKISHQKAVIAQLHSTIEELRRQRRLHLGAQLLATAVDVDTHARLQQDHGRLAAETTNLRQRLGEKEDQIAVLQEDLAASRHAHAHDIARLAADTKSTIKPMRRRQAQR